MWINSQGRRNSIISGEAAKNFPDKLSFPQSERGYYVLNIWILLHFYTLIFSLPKRKRYFFLISCPTTQFNSYCGSQPLISGEAQASLASPVPTPLFIHTLILNLWFLKCNILSTKLCCIKIETNITYLVWQIFHILFEGIF